MEAIPSNAPRYTYLKERLGRTLTDNGCSRPEGWHCGSAHSRTVRRIAICPASPGRESVGYYLGPDLLVRGAGHELCRTDEGWRIHHVSPEPRSLGDE